MYYATSIQCVRCSCVCDLAIGMCIICTETSIMWSIILNTSVGRFTKVICIATTSILRPKVSDPWMTGIGRFHCIVNRV